MVKIAKPIIAGIFSCNPIEKIVWATCPSTQDELFIILHELGHIQGIWNDALTMKLLLLNALKPSPREIIDCEIIAWLHAFRCVHKQFWGKLFFVAATALSTYVEACGTLPTDKTTSLLLRRLESAGYDTSGLLEQAQQMWQDQDQELPLWWQFYLKCRGTL